MRRKNGNLLRMELQKAIRNKFFFAALSAGFVFACMSALYNIESFEMLSAEMKEMAGNPMTQSAGLYNCWIGGESDSLGFALFYTLLPFLAAVPYGWSYALEKKTGYLKMVMVQTGRLPYLMNKYIATFISGGLVIVLPLVFNILFVACFVPAIQPEMIYRMYYPVHYGSLWSYLFFEMPAVFSALYLLLDFLFAGLFAVMGFAVSSCTNSRITAVVTPYFIILALHYGRTLLYHRVYKELSPLNFLHATCIENPADAGIILAEGAIILAVTLGIVIGKGRRMEN